MTPAADIGPRGDLVNGTGMEANDPGGRGPLSVLLGISDFPMLRAGFRSVLRAQPDVEIVGDGRAGTTPGDRPDPTAPDIAIIECRAPSGDADGFEVLERMRRDRPTTRIIAIDCRTAHSDRVSAALRAGADGFLTREATPDDVVGAVRTVSRGQTYVSPAIVSQMVNTYVLGARQQTPEDAYASLTDREREVLLLAAAGHTNREIAGRLNLPEGRVHHYRATVMEKLGLHDRVELLKYVIRHGVLGVADV